MRDDLLEAQASVDWAVSQIPLLADCFASWVEGNPYGLTVESDAETKENLLVAYELGAPDLRLNAWVGGIINAIRSSLDMLAASLARRNNKSPSADTHFPVFQCIMDMIDPLTGIDAKKWLSDGERAVIKTLKPYAGGNDVLFTLHRLDIERKHVRLLAIRPAISSFHMPVYIGGQTLEWKRTDEKTILLRYPATFVFDPDQANVKLTSEIIFNEAALGLDKHQVIPVLLEFARQASEIIARFDAPRFCLPILE